MDDVARSLKETQDTAAALFAAAVSGGLIAAGKLESEVTRDIHALARRDFGLRRHWHKRIVRSGVNTLCISSADPPVLEIGEIVMMIGCN